MSDISKQVAEQVNYELQKIINDPAFLRNELIKALERNEEKDREIKALIPANEFYKAVTASNDWMEMSAVAKVLAYKDWGRNKIFGLLKDREIIRYNKEPYQKYVDSGHFRTTEETFTDPYGKTKIYRKTMVSQKGLNLIRKLIEAAAAA